MVATTSVSVERETSHPCAQGFAALAQNMYIAHVNVISSAKTIECLEGARESPAATKDVRSGRVVQEADELSLKVMMKKKITMTYLTGIHKNQVRQ